MLSKPATDKQISLASFSHQAVAAAESSSSFTPTKPLAAAASISPINTFAASSTFASTSAESSASASEPAAAAAASPDGKSSLGDA